MSHLPTIDLDSSAGRAIIRLIDGLKLAETANGDWNGPLVIDLLTNWMEQHGLDPRAPAGSLGAVPPIPCRWCPAGLWPSDGNPLGPERADQHDPGSSRTWQDRDGAVHCRTPGDGHAAAYCGADCDRDQRRHQPLRVALANPGGLILTGVVKRIEDADGEDGWLVAPDDGAASFWTPASFAQVIDDDPAGTPSPG